MSEAIHFHRDLYRRDAVESAAEKWQRHARIELADAGSHVVAHLDALTSSEDSQLLRDEFCSDAFSETARRLRDVPRPVSRSREPAELADQTPPWGLLAPFTAGAALGLGWVLESLGPVRSGAATLVLRHEQEGSARVAVRLNNGAPLGVAHTNRLDFMLMNGGNGATRTDESVGRVLVSLAARLRTAGASAGDDALFDVLLPYAETGAAGAVASPAAEGLARIAPQVDQDEGTIRFDFDETGISRLALYDTVQGFADRCYVFLTRREPNRIDLWLRPRGEPSPDVLKRLVYDVTKALNHVRSASAAPAPSDKVGLRPLARPPRDVESVLAELDAAHPLTVGLGFVPERGPGHENLRVMNILGTGACNSDCLFCCEKFNPGNRLMPSTDATRGLILEADGQYDMLFFASGEPTLHPKLFEHVELAKSVGFTCFGMSSHFRTFADPRFALKTLRAGFEYFDISLHAADPVGQLDVNPIGDGGASLAEALKGLAIIYRLADVLGIRITVTQKIVVSRLNVTQLEAIFHAGYDRGVRNFILQPVRTLGLSAERQAALAITEDEILPHLNGLLRNTEGLGATIKPYGFSRQFLFAGTHVVHEQNRIKNVMGKHKQPRGGLHFPSMPEPRPSDGRFWVEVRTPFDQSFGFAADGRSPVLDQALRRGAQLPFGCRMGSCGMCCARLLEGTVDQSNQIFLSEEQQQQGYVLLCQARPQSDVTVMMCTDDEIDPL